MEQLTALDELRNLKWAVQSLAAFAGSPGSYEREVARNAARGIEARLDWIIGQVEALEARAKMKGA